MLKSSHSEKELEFQKISISDSHGIWSSKLDVVSPVKINGLHGFRSWVNWNGFGPKHTAFDFAAYLDESQRVVLGLSEKTEIVAVADGFVRQVSARGVSGQYAAYINIEHMSQDSGMFSSYHHVFPVVSGGTEVKKGDVIAHLYKDEAIETGRLVHLHFEMTNAWGGHFERQPHHFVDPATIFSELNQYIAKPWRSHQFKLEWIYNLESKASVEIDPPVVISNFPKLNLPH